MAITKVNLGTLYMNGQPVLFNTSTPTQYISGATLELKTSSSDTNYQIEWVSFINGAREYLLSTRNILSNISYNDLLTQSLLNGNVLVTINGIQYKWRILTSNEYDEYILNSINLTTLLNPTTQDETSGAYTDSTISSSDSNNLWHWWKLSSLTQDLSGSNVTIRGGNTINTTSTIDKSSRISTTGYRIILEKYNYPPVISETDGSLGSYTSSVVKEYTVTDADNDLFKVEEFLDGTVYRTLESQSSGTKFTFTLNGTPWSNLSAGTHTIIIRVTDACNNIVERKWLFNKIVDSTVGTSPNLTRPTIVTPTNTLSLTPINALDTNTIKFTVIGGELVYANEVNIVDNANFSVVVYNRKIESFDFEHDIPQGTLINGNTYQIKVRTYNSSGQYSAWSDTVLVKTLTPPDLMITSIIDGMIQSPNPVIIGTYSQVENDSLYSYIFNLYKDGELVETSEVLLDKFLQFQFSNLENKTSYTLEFKVITSSGMEYGITQDFYCMYLQSKLPAVMKLINDKSTGSIQITTYIRQILGRVLSGDNVTYIDGEWADLHNTVVIWDEQSSFKLDGDWTAKIWARDLEDNDVMLLKFTLDDNNYIELTRWHNMFSLSKYVNGIKLYELHSFIQGDIVPTDQFYFFIQNDTNLGLMNFDVKRVTVGRNTWFTPSYSNDVIPSYGSENGFLTYLNDDFKNLFLDNSIEGENVKLYIPTVNDLINSNIDAILGQAILGTMILGDNRFVELKSSQQYFTRTIDSTDSNKLKIFNTDGTVVSSYPNSKIGIRFVIKIPNTSKISVYKDTSDNCYLLALKILTVFSIQNIGNLNIGDKIKAYSIKYNNEIIRFTVLSKDDSTVSLISDVINTSKEFDKDESLYTNGNPNWNLSNIKQWLNSNIKIG